MANPDKERTDKIYAKDDEVTLIFSETDDDEDNYNHENENDEGTDIEEPQLSRSHEHLKGVLIIWFAATTMKTKNTRRYIEAVLLKHTKVEPCGEECWVEPQSMSQI